MNIDVNTFWIHIQEKKIAWVSFIFQESFKCRVYRMIEVGTLDEPIINKKELLSPALFGKLRLPYISMDLHYGCIFLYRNQFFIGLSSKDIDNTLPVISFRKLK
jgi:hypothetical protein